MITENVLGSVSLGLSFSLVVDLGLGFCFIFFFSQKVSYSLYKSKYIGVGTEEGNALFLVVQDMRKRFSNFGMDFYELNRW